jgi:uncharacterized protein YcbK (DUF882 family)
MQLSTHFKSEEFACHCGCGASEVNPKLVELLEDIREVTEHPIIITSGRRCEAKNKECGGKPKSQHLLGNAADIQVKGFTSRRLRDLIEKRFGAKVGGLGEYKTFVHVDVRTGTPARWHG